MNTPDDPRIVEILAIYDRTAAWSYAEAGYLVSRALGIDAGWELSYWLEGAQRAVLVAFLPYCADLDRALAAVRHEAMVAESVA